MLGITVCKGCDKREVGCHATCTAYLEAREALEEKKKLIEQERMGRKEESEFRFDVIEKIRKSKRTRW